ncbi:DUF4876 domain-containing protein [Xylanibacter oryzae]|uniref:DUF4876 domain-containing protein n=1 Tax=Xylanibacter oryzae TaxID=185293 RepID=UPI0005696155|nr:DUF4876 domain-containing protein [Xylanibacter oryzae]
MNKEKLFRLMLLVIAICITLASCKDNNEENSIQSVKFALSLDMPLNVNEPSLNEATATLTNVQTKMTYTATNFRKSGTQYVDTTEISAGIYSLDVKGDISYSLDTTLVKSTVKANESNVAVSASANSSTVAGKTIALNTYNAQDGFVISEIFFTGTLTPEGKQYSEDQYIKIANNSDSVLYADGLAFVESSFLTVEKEDYTPDIMNQAMTIDALYVILGKGKEHPVKPGKEIVIAFDAKNHKEINSNSIDLSSADFEFCDLSSNPNYSDDDNPNVPNLINWISDNQLQMLHNRGFKSYAIVRPDVDMKTFLNNYKYKYTYLLNYGEYSFDMDGEGYKLPNAWVVDAVNLSVADSYQWIVTSVSLDVGWTHCGSVDGDKTRYGKAVVRKKSGNRYIDTNNSTNDFDADMKPTLF